MLARLPRSSAHVYLANLVAAIGGLMSCGTSQAQVAPLEPFDQSIEIVDGKERISGGATTGVALKYGSTAIGANNLWVYLPKLGPSTVRLQISSIDGRYYAEQKYRTAGRNGWVPLRLNTLTQLSFLSRYDKTPLRDVAVLIAEVGVAEPRFFPAWWGPAHDAVDVSTQLPELTKNYELRVYVNTERATAFTVADGKTNVCAETPASSSFRFNAYCDVPLSAFRSPPAPGERPGKLDVHRRSGMRSIGSIVLTVPVD
jgi:hypothetical protein